MKTKLTFAALLCVIIFLTGCAAQIEAPIKIGAILPLSGPAAIWGENIQNGMILAQQELARQGIDVEIVFEDSQARADVGVTAYRKLNDVDDVDLIVSAFSRVSVPLVPLADEDQIPIIMTLVAAKGVAEQSPFSFRFYSNERQYVEPQFAWMDPAVYDKIAVLWINDEYGVAVHDVIIEQANAKGIEIVADENFVPRSADYRTQLTKIKEADPKAVLFVAATPPEVAAIKQLRELGITADIIENSALLAIPSARAAAGDAAEGAATLAFPYSLGKTGTAFKGQYQATFDAQPNFGAAFGYDMVALVGKASGGNAMEGDVLAQSIIAVQSFESLNGPVTIKTNGEINPPLEPVTIVNGELVAR